jgi:hypothetical protein
MSYYERHIAPDGRPWISNSLLSAGGRPQGITPEMESNFLFGRVFHTLSLEPKKQPETISPALLERAKAMRAAFWQAAGYDVLFIGTLIEHEVYRRFNGLWHKCKIDVLKKSERLIIDLKSTSAYNEAGFRDSIIKYGYDRQAYLYLNLAKADIFRLYGVSKVAPYKVFTVEIARGDASYQLGGIDYLEKLELLRSTWNIKQ